MAKTPIYLKTAPEILRPSDPEYYLMTREGLYFCRNHPFFESDVPTRRQPSMLVNHAPACTLRYPKVPATLLAYSVAFFDRVFYEHCSEAIVLLLWDMQRHRYKLWVPEQEPTVWESSRGTRSPTDVTYKAPSPLPTNHLQLGDIHSHADFNAYASHTDKNDEFYRDGIHIVVGRIEDEPPEFHLELAVDGYRFSVEFDEIVEGYQPRRRIVPDAWMDKVHLKVQRSTWTNRSSYNYNAPNDRQSGHYSSDGNGQNWKT